MTPRKPRKWNLPLTYAPKIEPVKRGDCTQTIRIVNYTKAHPEGNHKQVGDLVRFFTWSGKPYHSKRVWVMEEYKTIEWILNIKVFNTGIKLPSGLFAEWGTKFCYDLAALDYISQSTGEALRDVLVGMNGKIPEEGIEAQVIRWKV